MSRKFSNVLYIMTLYSKYSRAMTLENLCPQKVRESLCLAGHSTAVKDRPGTGLTCRIRVDLGQVPHHLGQVPHHLGQVPHVDSHVVLYVELEQVSYVEW